MNPPQVGRVIRAAEPALVSAHCWELNKHALARITEKIWWQRLKDADYAAEYLAQVLAENDRAAFLEGLKDVVEATGGMSVMAKRVGLKRPKLV